jgi:hypothetical protein
MQSDRMWTRTEAWRNKKVFEGYLYQRWVRFPLSDDVHFSLEPILHRTNLLGGATFALIAFLFGAVRNSTRLKTTGPKRWWRYCPQSQRLSVDRRLACSCSNTKQRQKDLINVCILIQKAPCDLRILLLSLASWYSFTILARPKRWWRYRTNVAGVANFCNTK